MDANEVVIGEVQGKRSVVVLPLLAESIGQPGESANLHPHGEVLSLYVRRANLVRVGLPDDWDHLRCDHFSRGVPLVAFAGRCVHLDELCEIHAGSEAQAYSISICRESASSDLEISRGGFIYLFRECLGISGGSAS